MAIVNESDLTKTKICNQGLSKDGWTIVDTYVDTLTKTKYYAKIKCNNCGYEKFVKYHSFINSNQVRGCDKCGEAITMRKLIGQTIGIYKIIDLDRQELVYYKNNPPRFRYYFLVECTKCGCRYIKPYNHGSWIEVTQCIHCNSPFKDQNAWNAIWSDYTGGASGRNLEWNLTPDKFKQLISGDCYYCGDSPRKRIIKQNKLEYEILANGIDRINSDLGYTPENTVSCCTLCNLLKNKYPQDLFLSQIEKIHNHLLNKQGSQTILKGSTSQANGDGNGRPLTDNAEGEEIVESA